MYSTREYTAHFDIVTQITTLNTTTTEIYANDPTPHTSIEQISFIIGTEKMDFNKTKIIYDINGTIDINGEPNHSFSETCELSFVFKTFPEINTKDS